MAADFSISARVGSITFSASLIQRSAHFFASVEFTFL